MSAFRRMVVSLLVVTMLLSLMPMVSIAQGPEGEEEKVFVRTDWDGNEKGTEANPYNTETEAIRYASSRPNGARIWKWNETEYMRTDQYVPYVSIPEPGAPLALQVLWGLALALALALVITGWALRKRSESSAEAD